MIQSQTVKTTETLQVNCSEPQIRQDRMEK